MITQRNVQSNMVNVQPPSRPDNQYQYSVTPSTGQNRDRPNNGQWSPYIAYQGRSDPLWFDSPVMPHCHLLSNQEKHVQFHQHYSTKPASPKTDCFGTNSEQPVKPILKNMSSTGEGNMADTYENQRAGQLRDDATAPARRQICKDAQE